MLKENFRSVDHICRLTEKEFVVIVTRVTRANKDTVLTKINEISETLKLGGDGIEPVELIVGVAFSDGSEPGSDVFRDADIALKRMKEIKNSGYSVY